MRVLVTGEPAPMLKYSVAGSPARWMCCAEWSWPFCTAAAGSAVSLGSGHESAGPFFVTHEVEGDVVALEKRLQLLEQPSPSISFPSSHN